ncbi:hypothetical protein MYK68_14970 [Gordonia sp. PP30]|uniref:hypothetical protein n=1 Tax=Gordonia sp. PP30 TaxID=2935861 RepID=UPI001FFF70A1|nr:hypothetical protein [Gordonia sp. PP30]UQE74028.1 hypothetical protein MYK68_14970 [Gordonia sp. PP30]
MTSYPTLPAHLKKSPTPSKVQASTELSRAAAREAVKRIGRAAAREAVKRIGRAAAALKALSETEYPSPAQMIAAVASWTAAEREIHAAVVDVTAAAVLGGAAVTTTARGSHGVRPQTLSNWLSGTAARYRGVDLEKSDGEWKPVHLADLHELDQEAQNPTDSAVRYTGNVGQGTSADAAGAQGQSIGAHGVSPGDSVDPEVLATAVAEAIGGEPR